MEAKELKEKIDLAVVKYNEKPNSNEYGVISIMNEINDLIEENGAFYTLKGADRPLISEMLYLNSILRWNKTYQHRVGLLDTYFDKKIYEVSLNQNIFNFLPTSKISNVKKLIFKSYEPTDKSMTNLMSDFCGTNDLNLIFLGTNYNSLGVVSTDMHKLIFLSKKDDKYENNETKCVSNYCLKTESESSSNIFENLKYPDWKRVIPKVNEIPREFTFDVDSLRKYLFLCLNFGLFYKLDDSLNVLFEFENDEKSNGNNIFSFNLIFLIECLDGLLKLGISEAKVNYGLNSRGIIFTDSKNTEKDFLNKNFIMLMPVISKEIVSRFRFDISSNSVVYADKKYELPFSVEKNISKDTTKIVEHLEKSKKQIVAPAEEKITLTKEVVKEKWGLPANEKKEWLNSLSEEDYTFAVTELANISIDKVSEPKKEMNIAQKIYYSDSNKFKKFKDLKLFNLKPNEILVLFINNKDSADAEIIYEEIQNKVLNNSNLFDRLSKKPEIRDKFGDRVSMFTIGFDLEFKKQDYVYDYFRIKGLDTLALEYLELEKNKKEESLKKQFPEDKRLIKGNEYYLWTKTRGDSSNPNNFHKYKYKGLLNDANKYVYGSENVYQFSNEHTSTHIAYEKMDNTFVNTEIYSVDDFNKWKKSYEEKNNPATKKEETPAESKSDLVFDNWISKPHNANYIKLKRPFEIGVRNYDCVQKIKDKYENVLVFKSVNNKLKQPINYFIIIEKWLNILNLKNIFLECYNDSSQYGFISEEQINIYEKIYEKETPAESKSDLDFLNEMLQTSKDLLDLISDTGSKEDVDFLKSKIEATENLISLLADDKFSKGGGVSEKEIQEWKKFVLDNSTWFDNESDNSSDEILLTTRRNGNTSEEEVGQMDIDEANDIAKKVISKFPKTQYNIERVDEYVHLYLRPNKTDKELEQEKAIKKIKDDQDKSAKIIVEKLNVTQEKALDIIKSFSYPKEYYEKYKNVDADEYNNSFRIYFSKGSPTNIDFDNAEQVFDYISKDDFIESIYNRSNPRNEVLIGLYGWDSLRIKYDRQGRPFFPNGETDWSKNGEIVNMYPFIQTNIYGKEDFFEKVKKAISEFIESYKIYVLNDYKSEKETPAESKSDLDFLNEMLQTSKDLLDLISDTGSKEDVNFLKSKIEATENLISLLGSDEVVKKKNILLAPNGKQSKLTPEQYKLVRSKEFISWFGDWENDPANASKVIDDNGEPLPVYHGTDKKFNVFNKSIETDYNGKYEFLVENVDVDSKKFKEIEKHNEERGSMSAYEDFWFSNISWMEGSKHILLCFLNCRTLYVDENGQGGQGVYNPYYGDGLKITNADGQNGVDYYVVNNSKQIKLADGTNTTFDGSNPDIRFDGGGDIL